MVLYVKSVKSNKVGTLVYTVVAKAVLLMSK